MNQQTIDKIQPYIDEYCRAKRAYDLCAKNLAAGYGNHGNANTLIQNRAIMDACEKAIMQILIEGNQLPTNPLI